MACTRKKRNKHVKEAKEIPAEYHDLSERGRTRFDLRWPQRDFFIFPVHCESSIYFDMTCTETATAHEALYRLINVNQINSNIKHPFN